MGNLYTYINNTGYLRAEIVNNIKKNGVGDSYLQEDIICCSAIRKISDYIIDYIQGNCDLNNKTVYTEISLIITNKILTYTDKPSIAFVIGIFKCYRMAYINLVIEEAIDNKSKLEITNYIEKFLMN